jgi:hypothetical protein
VADYFVHPLSLYAEFLSTILLQIQWGGLHFGQFLHELKWSPCDRCYDFLNIFAKMAFLTQNKATNIMQNFDHNIGL